MFSIRLAVRSTFGGPMKKLSMLAVLISALQGCTSNVEKFYVANTLVSESDLFDLETLVEPNEPEIIRLPYEEHFGNFDPAGMSSNNFKPLGESSFSGPAMTDAEAKRFAQKIGATHVIASQSYRNTNSGAVPMTTYTPNTTYHSGNVYSNYGTASYSGTSYGTTASTTYIPYSVNIYKVYATFWARDRSPPKIGALVQDLSADDARRTGRNTGAIIRVVVKNSPAFFANLLPGDVIIKINDMTVNDASGFWAAAATIDQRQKNFTCTVMRDSQELVIQLVGE